MNHLAQILPNFFLKLEKRKSNRIQKGKRQAHLMRPYFPRANPNFFTMMQNLRFVFAQVYCRGRSRNFSSTPVSSRGSSWVIIVRGIAAAAGGYAMGPFVFDVAAEKKLMVEENKKRMKLHEEQFEESEKYWSDLVARRKSEQTKRQ
ncbi:hypothetical protein CARUB_v10014838mg [Capsella rubella]|uniref:Uncharacterized protein n=2 Tax=Capsella rubella TaxID=81985 RepID=R0G817_9BRAS|nr:hypothetical protein CARUB_v10014838mg [Capsella rubella]